MLFLFWKIVIPRKKIGIIYQSRVSKNLNETIGEVDVIEVINIQNKYIKIQSVIGCLKILLNVFSWYAIRNNINIIKPNKIGSVGKAISTSDKNNPKSASETEKGVSITTRKKRYL